jgi:hypothetical protein
VSAPDDDRLVRPYLITQGRTRPVDELPIEALVEAHADDPAAGARLRFEPRRVLELCSQRLSIAEVAAALMIPLGVARVLVADLAADGLVKVHRTASADGPDVHLLERLLDGLRSC